jgi:hypothetical protein
MRFSAGCLVGIVLLASAGSAHADVQLSIQNGQVSLTATNATVREILAAWARIGQTRIVNGDRIPGGPISIQLTGVTEEQALEVILRSAAGYVTAPRPVEVANASRYDRILVMPTTTPTRAAAPPPPSFPQPQLNQFPQPPQFPPQQFPQQPPVIDDDVDDPQPAANVVLPGPRGPIFNSFPQPQAFPQPMAAPPPGTVRPAPGQMPIGVAVPGMVVPAPAQPGQPGLQIPRLDDQP